MAVTAVRSTVITFSGDVSSNLQYDAADNIESPGSRTIQDLASGANTITVPSATSITVTAVTIIPPADNEETITLKGVTGDTGVSLHPTDPTTIALASGVVNFVLTAGDAIADVAFVWT